MKEPTLTLYLINRIRKLFGLSPKQSHNKKIENIYQVEIGDVVRLEYFLPKDLGFVNPNTLSYCYLNGDELENTIIQGIVSNKNIFGDRLVIEISFFKKDNESRSFLRRMMFADDEIKLIERL